MTKSEKQKADIKISGMHCATCAVTVEESLAGIRDVSTVQVNFGTDTAHVEYDPAKVSLAELESGEGCRYEVVNREVTLKSGWCVPPVSRLLRQRSGRFPGPSLPA
jgi:Cu+-exporting ATPase